MRAKCVKGVLPEPSVGDWLEPGLIPMFPPQALTNDEFRKGCELIQPGGKCDLPLEAGVVVCYPLVRAGLGYVPSDFPSNGVGFDFGGVPDRSGPVPAKNQRNCKNGLS